MRGCAGAGGAHPDFRRRSILASTFTGVGFSRTLIASCLLVCFLHLSRPGGCKFGLGLAGGFLFFDIEPCLEAFEP